MAKQEEVELRSKGLRYVPREAVAAPAVASLDLAHNRITDLPQELESQTDLKRLLLSHNSITTFPSVLCKLHLTVLDLSFNRLSGNLTEAIGDLTSLTSLNLSFNKITSLPENISRLRDLKELNVANNTLITLPHSLTDMKSLTVFNVSSNTLRELPHNIGELQSLTKLDISHNQLTHLPTGVASLPQLSALEMRDNPWQCPAASVCAGGRDAVVVELTRLAKVLANAKRCEIIGMSNGTADVPIQFYIVAKDASGMQRVNGGDVFKVEARGPALTKAAVTDNRDGTYDVTITASAPGDYNLVVTVDGVQLHQCPLHFFVSPLREAGAVLKQLDTIEVAADAPSFEMGSFDMFEKYNQFLKLAKEFNISVNLPEVVVCGSDEPSLLVEALFGMFPFNLSGVVLRRPLTINFLFSEEAEPKLTLKQDKLLGANVPGGMRDMPVKFNELPKLIQARNEVVSKLPVYVLFEHNRVMSGNVTIAPALPLKGDAARHAVEKVVADLITPPDRLIICAQRAMEWKLVQMTEWTRWILQLDPTLARSYLVFSHFDDLINCFLSPSLLAAYFKNQPFGKRDGVYFVTLPDGAVRESLQSLEDLRKRLVQLEKLDMSVLDYNYFDQRLKGAVGVSVVREHLLRTLRSQCQSQAPLVSQRIAAGADVARATTKKNARLAAALAGPELPGLLRLTLSNYVLRFCQQFCDLLTGTVAAPPMTDGRTLTEEMSFYKGNTPFIAANSAVDHAQLRIYGGAALVRVLDHFRRCVDELQLPPGLTKAGLAQMLPEHVSSVFAASQLAQREVQRAMLPLVEQLCSQVVSVVRHMAQLAERVINERGPNECFAAVNTEQRVLLPSFLEYSYVKKHVKELYVEMVEQRAAVFREKCLEDFTSPSVLWDMPAYSLNSVGGQLEVQQLLANMFRKLVAFVSENLCVRFYSVFLQQVTVQVPTDMLTTLLSLQEKQLKNLFQIGTLEEKLKADQEASSKLVEANDTKALAVKLIKL
eukprot:TRINITY_DN1916_c0_g1_i1.p1 TRINITY_DN1916_c0_g1~~TRINITY_DN1916_c0_g1_i1.p1  ORF type:complete len:1004 (+),score=298.73 TRINITY_DN1916_c0_g1_i1:31-3012(+)